MIEIRFDENKLRAVERMLADIPRALPQVMSRGLNRTATEARTQMSRELSQRTGLRVGDVRKRLWLERASYQSWRSAVTVSRKQLSLSYLNPQGTKRGLSVKLGQTRLFIRRAFPALKGWFIRLPAAGGVKGNLSITQASQISNSEKLVGRLPIGRIKGPALAQVYADAQDTANRIYAESLSRLEKNINDQVQLILRRRAVA